MGLMCVLKVGVNLQSLQHCPPAAPLQYQQLSAYFDEQKYLKQIHRFSMGQGQDDAIDTFFIPLFKVC